MRTEERKISIGNKNVFQSEPMEIIEQPSPADFIARQQQSEKIWDLWS